MLGNPTPGGLTAILNRPGDGSEQWRLLIVLMRSNIGGCGMDKNGFVTHHWRLFVQRIFDGNLSGKYAYIYMWSISATLVFIILSIALHIKIIIFRFCWIPKNVFGINKSYVKTLCFFYVEMYLNNYVLFCQKLITIFLWKG